MDILVSSNLERLLYEAADRNGDLIRVWMKQLKESGSYSVGEQRRDWMADVFCGDYADNKDTVAEISKRYAQDRYLMDPHTAVAGHVLRKYREQYSDDTPTVIVGTASPYKFAADVLKAVSGEETDDPFTASERLEQLTGIPMPEQVRRLKEFPVRHTAACDKDKMAEAILEG